MSHVYGAVMMGSESAADMVYGDDQSITVRAQAVSKGRKWSGEERLALAVLQDVLHAERKNRGVNHPRARKLHAEAVAWLYDKRDSDWPFTCANICELFGISQSAMLKAVLSGDGVKMPVERTRANIMGEGWRLTHCKRGHELTPENRYRAPNSPTDRCRICINLANQAASERLRREATRVVIVETGASYCSMYRAASALGVSAASVRRAVASGHRVNGYTVRKVGAA